MSNFASKKLESGMVFGEHNKQHASAQQSTQTAHNATVPANNIEQKFLEAIESMGIKDESKKEQLKAKYKSPKEKWNFVLMMSKANGGKTVLSQMHYINKLKDRENLTLNDILGLAVELRSSIDWNQGFVKNKGIEELINTLSWYSESNAEFTHELVVCCYSIMNASESILNDFVNTPNAILCLIETNFKSKQSRTKNKILTLLAVICQLHTAGFQQILNILCINDKSLKYLMELKQSILELSDVDFKISTLMFFNALLDSTEDEQTLNQVSTILNCQLCIIPSIKSACNNVSEADFKNQLNILESQLAVDTSPVQGNAWKDNPIVQLIQSLVENDVNEKHLTTILQQFLTLSKKSSSSEIMAHNYTVIEKAVSDLMKNVDQNGKLIATDTNTLQEKVNPTVAETTVIESGQDEVERGGKGIVQYCVGKIRQYSKWWKGTN